MKLKLLSLIAPLLFLGCSSLSLEEKTSQQEVIDKMARTTISELIKATPKIQTELDKAVGYAVINWKVTKVPVVGVGGGNGVIVNFKTNKHTYVKVSRFDIGGGWGARSYKNLVIIHNEETIKDGEDGLWKIAGGAEVSAGTAAVGGGSEALNTDTTTHMLVDGGGSATATIRVMNMSLNSGLND